jgi:hypothetical protein
MTYSKEEQTFIAETILSQLGGHLKAMIGAYNVFACEEGGLVFRFKARASNGSNHCKVTLVNDLYTVVFTSVRGSSIKVKGTFEDIYNDQLRKLFERETGLCLTMPIILFARAQ